MRTARAIVLLAGNARPASQATLAEATEALDRLAEGAPRIGAVRFVGYETPARVQATIPDGTRCATYEADYPDT